MEVEKLLLKIHAGKKPSAADLEEVVRVLSGVSAEDLVGSGIVDDVYAGILVIGRGKLLDLGHLVAKFLDSKDSLTVSLILETFCLEWGIFDEYFERIIDFALGVSWDSDHDVRHTALKILGEYLERRLSDSKVKPTARIQEVIGLLLTVVDDVDADDDLRTAAYRAGRRGGGVSWDELPAEGEIVELTPEKIAELQSLRDLLAASAEPSVKSPRSASASPSAGRTSPGIR